MHDFQIGLVIILLLTFCLNFSKHPRPEFLENTEPVRDFEAIMISNNSQRKRLNSSKIIVTISIV